MKIDGQMREEAVVNEIASRIKQYRILYPMTQAELAEKAMLSESTIKRFEAGEDIGFQKLIRILNALGLQSKLDLMVPDQSIRPSLQVGLYEERKRASRKKELREEWKWGDEK
ncbi:MAG: helix-turn-helix transcriptional regulator [Acetatifactor sp.]|nr:helix-turn-helix transcriptional regulator [Acetatifactor sp.]